MIVLVVLFAPGCGGPARSRPAALPSAQDHSGAGRQLRALAWAHGNPLLALNAPAGGDTAVMRGRLESPGRWSAELRGAAGALAAEDGGGLVIEHAGPASADALWFDPRVGPAATPDTSRRVPLRATDYVVVADAAMCGDGGAVIAGSFGGTLRVGSQVVSTGGQRDGFVARLDARGQVSLLLRMGGDGDDGFGAVDCRADVLAVAGTFSQGAELRGALLQRMVARSPYADAVVVLLRGGDVVWTRTFGGGQQDLTADLALTARGDVAVVGVARGELAAGDVTLEAQGQADGYLARWSAAGDAQGALRLGGPDYDGASQVVALGELLIVGGFFTGTAELGGVPLTARGGDDAMLVTVRDGIPSATAISGDGREEIVSLVRAGEGVALGIAHTAGFAAWNVSAAPPADPLGGVTVVLVPSL
ncbi:MAG: hypothetical protein IPI49_02410 [Myxococcales bacterium]|nr:hypothetical protein [Myxococcales bacterium]